MALKSGRVGVAPDQVDDFGKINSEATSGYTKQEADAKFETQTHASSTYETKSEATSALAEKQSINLSVPLHMLNGSALTVEQALNNGLKCSDGTNEITTDFTIDETKTELKKIGNIVFIALRLTGVTAAAWSALATLPEGYRPTIDMNVPNAQGKQVSISSAGVIAFIDSLSSGTFTLNAVWIAN